LMVARATEISRFTELRLGKKLVSGMPAGVGSEQTFWQRKTRHHQVCPRLLPPVRCQQLLLR